MPEVAVEEAIGTSIDGRISDLHPEGVVWDPSRSAFLVGSIRYGSVSIVDLQGRTRPLVTEPGLVATGGVRVDLDRRRVLATYDDVFAGPGALLSERSAERTAGHLAGLGIFDLDTGRTLHLVDLGWRPGLHLANDVAIGPSGEAYVTDSFDGVIYRVSPEGQARVFVEHPDLQAPITDGLPEVGLNGIACHPGGYLLTVRYDTGTLVRVPLAAPNRFTAVSLDQPVIGGDGITLLADGTLIVVTNTIRSTGIDGVFHLRPDKDWATASTLRRSPWPDSAPTMAATTPVGEYVLSSKLDLLFSTGGERTADGFTLRRFPLP